MHLPFENIFSLVKKNGTHILALALNSSFAQPCSFLLNLAIRTRSAH